MTSWIAQRIFQALLTIFLVITLSFALIRAMPGGPMDYLRATLAQQENIQDPQQLEAIMQIYIGMQPDDPLWQQYIDYMLSAFQGDFGRSIVHDRSVSEIYAAALPWTVFVMLQAILLFWSIGVVLGASMAYVERSRTDVTLSTAATIMTSIPYYVFAVLLLFILGRLWGIFPSGGRYPSGVVPGFNIEFVMGALYHGLLPVFSFVAAAWGGVALGMRGNSISVLGSEYLRVGQLRGLPQSYLAIHYVGRNAILPLYTSFLITLGTLFGGSIILETIFRYPGAGYYLFNAIGQRDYPVLMGGFIIITIAVVFGVFIADITYGKIDPRISTGDRT